MPVIVLGMHRSGTSALTRLIHLLGVPIGRADDLMSPQPDNPTGFWESQSLSRFNDRLLEAVEGRWWLPPRAEEAMWEHDRVAHLRDQAADALKRVYGEGDGWVWKDPRNCLTLSFWLEHLPSRPAMVFIYRHPLEVITSLRQRNELPPLVAGGLWEIYNRSALAQLTGLPTFTLSYEQLLGSPAEMLRRLSYFLSDQGLEVNHAPDPLEVQRLVSQQMRHYRFGEVDLLGPSLSSHQRALYEFLRCLPEQCQEFHAGAAPAESPLVYPVLKQHADAVHQIETAQREAASARRELCDAQAVLQQTQRRLARCDARRHTLEGQMRGYLEYYGQLRFRIAERANRALQRLPGAHRLASMCAGAARHLVRSVRRREHRDAVPTMDAPGNDGPAPTETQREILGEGLAAGDRHYRAFVGPPDKYDLVAAMQFNLLTSLGLREHHYLLDIGCGSLRAGRLLIPYLLPGHYCGIEPERWLVEQGIEREVGQDQVRIKRPRFDYNSDLLLSVFEQQFDFIVAQSIFSHTSERQIRTCLGEAQRVLKPGGAFAATFARGEDNYAGAEWVYPDCVTYTLEHLQAIAGHKGLTCERLDQSHPNGQTWVVFRLGAAERNRAAQERTHPAHPIGAPHRWTEVAVEADGRQAIEDVG